MTLNIRALVPLTGVHLQAIQTFKAVSHFAHRLHKRSVITRLWKTYSPRNSWPSASKSSPLGYTNRRAIAPASAVLIHSHTSRWAAICDLTGAMCSHGLSAIRKPLEILGDLTE